MKQSQLPGHEHGEAAEIAACCYSAQSPSNNQSCTIRQAEAGVTRRTGDKSRHRIGSHSDFFKFHHKPNHSRQVWERSEVHHPKCHGGHHCEYSTKPLGFRACTVLGQTPPPLNTFRWSHQENNSDLTPHKIHSN